MTTTADNLSYRHWQLRRDIDGICWLTLDRQDTKLNTLGDEVIAELERVVTALEQEPPAGLILLSGKRGSFIAGADIREFDQIDSADQGRRYIERVHHLFNRIEKLPFPSAVGIDGVCLGGGLELALCFDYRIARDVPATRIGFPEVKLGIFPGFGGSARTIEMLGAMQALPFILQGRNVSAKAARGLGLIDEVVGPHQELTWAARRAVLGRRRSKPSGTMARLTNNSLARRPLASYVRKQTEPHANPAHYPAPYALLDAWERHGDDRAAMLRAEAEQVSQLLVSDTSRNLRRVFQLMERLKAEGKRTHFKARRVHVMGAGVMGGDIAAWCALRGLEVTLQDRELAQVKPALERATELFKRKLKDDARVQAAQGRLRADIEGRGVARADVVIEAIFEDLAAKQELMRHLEPQLQPHALLATNTSALDLAAIANVLTRPGRLIGLHFFNPVAKMPLVEVVEAPGVTDSDELARGSAFAVAIDKLPVTVRNSPGFLVNRVLGNYMANALMLHRSGRTIEEIDQAAEWFGMPMGPVELADTVGLDIGMSVMRTLGADPALLAELERMVASGRKGRKSGEGFYLWKNGKAQKGVVPGTANPAALAPQLMQPYFDECRAALAEGIVDDADLLDAAMIFGTGFPPFRGGPLHYQQSQGQQAQGQQSQSPQSQATQSQAPQSPSASGVGAAAAPLAGAGTAVSAEDEEDPTSSDSAAAGTALRQPGQPSAASAPNATAELNRDPVTPTAAPQPADLPESPGAGSDSSDIRAGEATRSDTDTQDKPDQGARS